MSDRAAVICFILFLLAIIGSIYLSFAAPCEQVDWMPVKDVPARCL